MVNAETLQSLTSRQAPGAAIALHPGVDGRGRTVILSGRNAGAGGRLPISLLHLGDGLRRRARQLGMSNLAAKVCVALIENGSLRKAAAACQISYQTARSEIADALRVVGANSQCALVHRLAADWLAGPLEGGAAVELLSSTFDLTRRDARIAALLATGCSRVEAARRLGISQWAIKSSCSHVFTALGVSKAPEITRIVIDLLLVFELAAGRRKAGEGAMIAA